MYQTAVNSTSSAVNATSTAVNTNTANLTLVNSTVNATQLSPANEEILLKAQKSAKYAISSLQYEDIPTAIRYLEEALTLLKK